MNELALIGQPAFLDSSMLGETGTYRISTVHGEAVRAFIPHALPPAEPPLAIEGDLADRHAAAVTSIGRIRVAGAMVPDPGWFLYGFVRKEAVLSSQIEGTQATLRDVATFEATSTTDRPADVEEICNYVTALNHARGMIADSAGLTLSARLLCDVHRILIRGWQHNRFSVDGSVRISLADRDVSGNSGAWSICCGSAAGRCLRFSGFRSS